MRKIINLNQGWCFKQEDAGLPQNLPADWPSVDLPHTWNAVDGHDGNGPVKNAGMQRALIRRSSLWKAAGYM